MQKGWRLDTQTSGHTEKLMLDNRFSKMRRIIIPGYTYFITNVTDNRKPFLLENIDIIWGAFESIKEKVARVPWDPWH